MKKREEIKPSEKWNLNHLFENLSDWEKSLQESEKELNELIAQKDAICETADNLYSYYENSRKLSEKIAKVGSYAFLWEDEDARDSKRQELGQKLVPFDLKASEYSSVVTSKILAMGEEKFYEFVQQKPELKKYEMEVKDFFRYAPHILSEKEEYILSQTSLLGNSSEVFERLTNADMIFPEIEGEDGETIRISEGNYGLLMESNNRKVRKDAYKALMGTYSNYLNTLSTTLSSALSGKYFYTKMKKHNSTLEKSLFSDEIPLEVYENLIATVKKDIEPMEKYHAIRKKALGLEELRSYDMSVPLVSNVNKKYSYDEAYETMTEGLAVLGEQYISDLKKAKDSGWIDVHETEGKRSGAYNMGVYGVHPYVLLNHNETLDSVFTLAHEMGHAMHSFYSAKKNESTYSGYSIFVAEVASTVNEVLLMKHLLSKTEDKQMKKYLLNQFLDQFRGTFYTQTMFAEFEKIVHEKTQKSEPLTPEVFGEIFGKLTKEYNGKVLIPEEEAKNGWSRIPHFYRPFYVYKYATGFAAANSLAKQILEEGEPAVERYLNFLQSGSTKPPLELLKDAGVDMSSPEPIEDAVSIFKELVDELEKLI